MLERKVDLSSLPFFPPPFPQRMLFELKTSMRSVFGQKSISSLSYPPFLLFIEFFFGSIKRFVLEPREFLDSVLEIN